MVFFGPLLLEEATHLLLVGSEVLSLACQGDLRTHFLVFTCISLRLHACRTL